MYKILSVIFFALTVVTKASESETEVALPEVPCRLIFNFFYVNVGDVKACLVDVAKPELNAKYRIQSEVREDITAFDIRNWQITHLPTGISEKFPNLMVYAATANAIKEISACNFRGLKKMKAMYLSYNQIQEIPPNTFAGLEAMEHLHLRKLTFSIIDVDLY